MAAGPMRHLPPWVLPLPQRRCRDSHQVGAGTRPRVAGTPTRWERAPAQGGSPSGRGDPLRPQVGYGDPARRDPARRGVVHPLRRVQAPPPRPPPACNTAVIWRGEGGRGPAPVATGAGAGPRESLTAPVDPLCANLLLRGPRSLSPPARKRHDRRSCVGGLRRVRRCPAWRTARGSCAGTPSPRARLSCSHLAHAGSGRGGARAGGGGHVHPPCTGRMPAPPPPLRGQHGGPLGAPSAERAPASGAAEGFGGSRLFAVRWLPRPSRAHRLGRATQRRGARGGRGHSHSARSLRPADRVATSCGMRRPPCLNKLPGRWQPQGPRRTGKRANWYATPGRLHTSRTAHPAACPRQFGPPFCAPPPTPPHFLPAASPLPPSARALPTPPLTPSLAPPPLLAAFGRLPPPTPGLGSAPIPGPFRLPRLRPMGPIYLPLWGLPELPQGGLPEPPAVAEEAPACGGEWRPGACPKH